LLFYCGRPVTGLPASGYQAKTSNLAIMGKLWNLKTWNLELGTGNW
jgi:hypothetical protein